MVMRQALIGILIAFLLGWGATASQAEPQKVELLLVDETQTLQASILVQILAQALLETDLFQLEAKIVDVPSSFHDPLGLNPTEKKYELILIIPRGLEDGSLRQLWIATQPITHKTRPQLMVAIETIKSLIAQGTAGRLEALGVMDDLIPAWFAAIFARNGWLL